MDRVSTEVRSKIMSRIKSKDTKPEKRVRSLLHAMGYRFRLHRKDLPGKPDVVLPKYKTAIFVHGCFWHSHEHCLNGKKPKTNTDYWLPKLAKNKNRDLKCIKLLEENGWKVIVIWECQTKLAWTIKKMIKNILA